MAFLRLATVSLSLMVTTAAAHGQSGATAAAIDAEVWRPVAASVVNDDIAAIG
jgi:hypothetical protein